MFKYLAKNFYMCNKMGNTMNPFSRQNPLVKEILELNY